MNLVQRNAPNEKEESGSSERHRCTLMVRERGSKVASQIMRRSSDGSQENDAFAEDISWSGEVMAWDQRVVINVKETKLE